MKTKNCLLFLVSVLFVSLFSGCASHSPYPRVYGAPPPSGAWSGDSKDLAPTTFRFLGVAGVVSGDTATFASRLPGQVGIFSGENSELVYLDQGGTFTIDMAKVARAGFTGKFRFSIFWYPEGSKANGRRIFVDFATVYLSNGGYINTPKFEIAMDRNGNPVVCGYGW